MLLAQLMSTSAISARETPEPANVPSDVSDPSAAMLNISTTLLLNGSATARNLPSGLTLAASGVLAVGNCEVSVSTPFVATLNTETVLAPLLAAIRNLPSGVGASALAPGAAPVLNGDPATEARAPLVESMVKTLTSADTALEANSTSPLTTARLVAKNPPPSPVPPVGNGEPATGVSVPFVPTDRAETVLLPARPVGLLFV